jgi:hypothetical protein
MLKTGGKAVAVADTAVWVAETEVAVTAAAEPLAVFVASLATLEAVTFWLALDVPSGWYMLTNLEGSHCFDQHGKTTTSVEKIPINGGTVPMIQDGGFLSLVKSIPVASASIQPDGITYNVIITPTSLSLMPGS